MQCETVRASLFHYITHLIIQQGAPAIQQLRII